MRNVLALLWRHALVLTAALHPALSVTEKSYVMHSTLEYNLCFCALVIVIETLIGADIDCMQGSHKLVPY